MVCVPAGVTDTQLLQVASHYNQSRWPVATWRHPRTGTVLLRSSSIVPTNVVAKLKGGLAQLGYSPQMARKLTPLALPSIGLQSQEVRSYIAAITAATPRLRRYGGQLLFEDGNDINKILPGLRQVQGDRGGEGQQGKRHSTFFVDISEETEEKDGRETRLLSEIKKEALQKAFTGSLDSRLMKSPSGASIGILRYFESF